ncbi:MAG: hypothetical protein QXO69_00685, partial [archaeon]
SQSRKENGTFKSLYTVNMKDPSDSLGITAKFKRLCQAVDVPCKIKIGEKNGVKYAWVSAYFGGWMDVDAYQNVKAKPSGYNIIYEEPNKREVIYDPENPEQSILAATAFVRGVGASYFYVYIIAILVALVSVVGLLQWKARLITPLIERGRGTTVVKEKINGQYSIIKQPVPDRFLNEVLQKIIERKGVVDVTRMSEEMKYSKELVSFGVSYLHDSGYIKKTGEIEEKTPIIIAEKKPAEKLPKKKILLVIALVAIALITIVLLLE